MTHHHASVLSCLVFVSACGLDVFSTRDDSARASRVPDAGPPGDGIWSLSEGPALLRVLTYNVAGLPESISGGQPQRDIPLISPLLNDYELALVQEDFAYHAALVSAAEHPFQSAPDSSSQSLGDGLNLLSFIPFESFVRDGWNACHGTFDSGSDCLTPKGFTRTRLTLGEERVLDVYDVHMDAGHSSRDERARRDNFAELTRAIQEHSRDVALLVAGDFNERYRDDGENMEQLLANTGLIDSWAEFIHASDLPSTDDLIAACMPDPDALDCERIDKVLYRPSDDVAIELLDYTVELDKFVDASGAPLSDHKAVSASFELTAVP